jgi:imidazolonepropionase-like amidohydrolase
VAPNLAVRAGRLFDGERARGPGTVLIEEGRIVDVDTTGAPVPDGASLIDLGEEACLLPGLIDAHVHLAFNASLDVLAALDNLDDGALLAHMREAAGRALRAGVTTVRDLGDRNYLAVTLADQLSRPGAVGPEVLAAGPPITTRGGHCHFLGGEADGRQALRAAVRQRAERGCQVVKVMASGGNITPGSLPHQSQYGPDDLHLIVDEAHRMGLPAAAHVHGAASIADALEAGFDTLEHVTFFTATGVEADQATMDQLVQRQVVVSATVGIIPGAPGPPPEVAIRIPMVGANMARLHRAGARIIPGTDAGLSPAKPHDVLPYGLEMLVERAGMTNAEALRAATALSALACGLGGRKGRLMRGADADLLAVNGDPLVDIAAVRDVRAVFRAGHRVR